MLFFHEIYKAQELLKAFLEDSGDKLDKINKENERKVRQMLRES